MKYLKHKIRQDGHIELWENTGDGKKHKRLILVNEPAPEYLEIKEDEDFEKYRTQEKADAYEAKLAELEPTPEELAEQEAKRQLKEQRKQVKLELKASLPPQSNPELAERVKKLEFVLGIRDSI